MIKKGESAFLKYMESRQDIRVIGEYQNGLIPIKIQCTICNEYLSMLPKTLKRGNGHKKCSMKSAWKERHAPLIKRLMKQAQDQDSENYWDLSEVKYINYSTPVPIRCKLCNTVNLRTLQNHVDIFAPCRNKCAYVKSREYDLPSLPIESSTPHMTEPNDVAIEEEWKSIRENQMYECSSLGRFRNKVTNKLLKGCVDKNTGYLRITLIIDGKMVVRNAHQWIARTFLPNPQNKLTVNHRDKNRTNNVLSNLEWATHAEQNDHKNETTKTFDTQYKAHNNGRSIQRLHMTTFEIIEEYPSLVLAAIWIMRHVDRVENIESKDCQIKIDSLSASLSSRLKKRISTGLPLFIGGFIWRFTPEEDTITGEEWKDIPDLSPYQVSSHGRIRGKDGKMRKGSICSGYNDHKLGGKHYKTHRLVAQLFLPNPDKKPFVNHKDGDHLNNHVENLEWVTNAENIQHAYDTGLHPGRKPIVQITEDGRIIELYDSATRAAKELGLSQSDVSAVCRGKRKQTNEYYFRFW